jgi:PGF-pre-PGF domain-containing protein
MFVNITGNVSAGLITTMVEVLRGTSALVKDPAPGIVYKNINIWVGTSGFAVPKNIKEADITFRIENSWLDNNSVLRNEVKLLKWDGSKWITLETSEKMRDSMHTYFEAKTDSFSQFAIASIKVVPSAAPSEATLNATPPKPTTETPGAPIPTPKSPGFEAILAAFGIIIALVHQRR